MLENSAWSYQTLFPGVDSIAGMIRFNNRLVVEVDGILVTTWPHEAAAW